MGGQAFLTHSPPLPTPRMPHEVYTHVLFHTQTLLKEHYTHVSTPLEAPGKTTYGDVDIVLFGPKTLPYSPDASLTPRKELSLTLAKLLDASASIAQHGSGLMSFAIPWPSIPLHDEKRHGLEGDESGPHEERRFVQVDVHHCSTLQAYEYELFHAAHGDLWNILGSTIRPLGLTVNNIGLYLRIPSIEAFDRKKSMVFLTSSPSEILFFLGLNEERFWSRFEGEEGREEMFRFAAGGRMFWIQDVEMDGEKGRDTSLTEGGHANDEGEQEGAEPAKQNLKHNDRARMAKRPIFREWIERFIPKLRLEAQSASTQPPKTKLTREQIRDEAFTIFRVQDDYERRERAWLLGKNKELVLKDAIKGAVPTKELEPQVRGLAIKILKEVIIEGEKWEEDEAVDVDGERNGGVPKDVQRDERGFWDVDSVKRWVEVNWEKALRLGLERQQGGPRKKRESEGEQTDETKIEGGDADLGRCSPSV